MWDIESLLPERDSSGRISLYAIDSLACWTMRFLGNLQTTQAVVKTKDCSPETDRVAEDNIYTTH